MKKKKVITILSLIAGLVLFLTMGTACTGLLNAEPLDNNGGYPPLVEKLAERFDLDRDELMEFMEELKQEKRAEMEERFEQRLDELVEEGELTEDQKEAILDKKQEMESFREDLEDMKVSEAREAIKEIKEEIKDWAEENDIDLRFLFPKAAAKGWPGALKGPGPGCRW